MQNKTRIKFRSYLRQSKSRHDFILGFSSLLFDQAVPKNSQRYLADRNAICILHQSDHGLRTPNEGTNQRYLKNWADVADKICFVRT